MREIIVRTQADLESLNIQDTSCVEIVIVPSEAIDISADCDLRRKCPDCGAIETFVEVLMVDGTYGDCSACGESTPQMLWDEAPWLDKVTVRGESSPIHPDWVRGIRDRCQAEGVDFVFDGWGDWFPSHMYDYDTERPILDGRKEIYIGPKGQIVTCASPFEHGCPYCVPPKYVSMVKVGKRRSGRMLDGREWG